MSPLDGFQTQQPRHYIVSDGDLAQMRDTNRNLAAENEKLRAALAAAEARCRELSEWRTMENAPKDGRWVVIGWPNGHSVIVRFSQEDDGWHDSDFRMYFDNNATGWHELPPLPSTETKP